MENTPSSDLIICIKNNFERFKAVFHRHLNQHIAFNQIILVDDFSNKDTKKGIKSLSNELENLTLTTPDRDILGKKLALLKGVNTAEAEWIFLTDADCEVTPYWQEYMLKEIRPQTEIVLGFAPFYKRNTWVNLWSRFECIITALQYLSFATWRVPYMGVGRNLVYKRHVFLEKNNLHHHLEYASGDDDMAVASISTSDNTEISLDPKSFNFSEAPSNWVDYKNQKVRHYSVSGLYPRGIKFLLFLFFGSHLLFYLLLLALIVVGALPKALLYWSIRVLPIWFFSWLLFKKLNHTDIWKFWPLLDLLLVLHYIYFSLYVLFPKKQKWK